MSPLDNMIVETEARTHEVESVNGASDREKVQEQREQLLNSTVTQSPQELHHGGNLPFLGNLLLAVFPILFLALAATSVTLDKQPTSQVGSVMQQAIALSPTAFPIVFSAIIGKLLRATGLYLAEREIKLGTLERLIGSQSFFSAIERQVLLRGEYPLGICLILLWALSPLGGQAALRLLSLTPRFSEGQLDLRYLPIASVNHTLLATTGTQRSKWASYGPLFMTALTTSSTYQNSTEDLFRNVRIPSLDVLTPVTNSSWQTINYGQPVPYSSLLGVPVVGVPAEGNVTFNLLSRHSSVPCSSSRQLAESDVFQKTLLNETSATFVIQYPWDFVYQPRMKYFNATTVPFNLTSMSLMDPRYNLSFVECTLEPRDVESTVFCVDQLCKVTSMRHIALDTRFWKDLVLAVQNSFTLLAFATDQNTQGIEGPKLTSSMVDMWLENPYKPYAPSEGKMADLSAVPLPTLSRNMEVLYNTWWDSAIKPLYRTGNLTTSNMSAYDDIVSEGFSIMPTLSFNTSQAVTSTLVGEQYHCNTTFAGLLATISCLLFIAAVATMILNRMTLAPDILGYVSSLTMDNPYTITPQASYMDGLERSRTLRNLRVIVGDVNKGSKTGHVAFTTASAGKRLEKKKRYI